MERLSGTVEEGLEGCNGTELAAAVVAVAMLIKTPNVTAVPRASAQARGVRERRLETILLAMSLSGER
jgi:hypothetical protein